MSCQGRLWPTEIVMATVVEIKRDSISRASQQATLVGHCRRDVPSILVSLVILSSLSFELPLASQVFKQISIPFQITVILLN
jgi:hypothetical protein